MLGFGWYVLCLAGFNFTAMCVIYLISIVIDNPTIIDVWWSAGISIPFSIYLILQANDPSLNLPDTDDTPFPASTQPVLSDNLAAGNYVLASIFLFWGARLSLYLLITRVAKSHNDARYVAMEKSWNGQQVYLRRFFAFQFQAVLQFILLLPFLYSCYRVHFNFSISVLIFAILGWLSVILQGHADLQISSFVDKKIALIKANPGMQLTPEQAVCKEGLWNYSRHPNYFFEMLIWIAYCGIMMSQNVENFILLTSDSNYDHTSGQFWSFLFKMILPILPVIGMFIIFRYITGPITEGASLRKRPVIYGDYMKSTPMIFPLIYKPNFISNMEVKPHFGRKRTDS